MLGYVCLKIEDVAEIRRGKRLVRNQLAEREGYPVYQNSMIPLGYHTDYNCRGNKTFIIAAGAAGEIGYSYEDFWAADDCYYFECSELITDRYLYYALQSKQKRILSKVRKASIPRLGRSVLENLSIKIPSVEEQHSIVNILDRFEVICNDISTGLPAEIEARKKQYEYYRNKLLSFSEGIGVQYGENFK